MNRKKVLLTHSFKGGTGKTVLAINIAHYLAKTTKVLFIDGDLLAPSLEKVIPQKDEESIKKTWPDFLEGTYSDVEDVIYDTPIDNLDVIYSPPPEIGKSFLSEKKMNWWVTALRKELTCRDVWFQDLDYDYVIIDNQNGISMNSANNITTSDCGFLVLRPVTYGVSGTSALIKEMYKTIHGIRERADYLIWNQIPRSSNKKQNTKVNELLRSWDEYFKQINVDPIAKIYYNADLSISMLEESNKSMLGVSSYIQKHVKDILKISNIT
ncbi:MAG: ParA family protein [Candidatus Hodarchaeales archaeon]|jgi:MinD-like ATPase involved in chromosome partitioning or flagellar assembly